MVARFLGRKGFRQGYGAWGKEASLYPALRLEMGRVSRCKLLFLFQLRLDTPSCSSTGVLRKGQIWGLLSAGCFPVSAPASQPCRTCVCRQGNCSMGNRQKGRGVRGGFSCTFGGA